jgi:hypothetical protein
MYADKYDAYMNERNDKNHSQYMKKRPLTNWTDFYEKKILESKTGGTYLDVIKAISYKPPASLF